MATYDSLIGRTDLAGLIPVEVSNEMAGKISKEDSNVLRMARRLRDMNHYQSDMPVMSALATASFLDGDTALIETAEVNWADVTLYAKELAAIVPIPRRVLDDASIPIWSQVRPDLEEAMGLAIDNAMLYGTNKPAAWPTSIQSAANTAGHAVSLAGAADLYEALLDESGVWAFVEEDGFAVDRVLADLTVKAKLRGTRDANGNPIFTRDPVVASQYVVDGVPIDFPRNGCGSSTYMLFAGDWKQLVYSIREDMSWSLSKDGVIQDAAGNIIYNLFQQDMVAIRVIMRLAFALPNPINRVNVTEATRYPFAYLTT